MIKELQKSFLENINYKTSNFLYVLKGFEPSVNFGTLPYFFEKSRLEFDLEFRGFENSPNLLKEMVEKLSTTKSYYIYYSDFLLLDKVSAISTFKLMNYNLILLDFNLFDKFYYAEISSDQKVNWEIKLQEDIDNIFHTVFSHIESRDNILIYSLNDVDFEFHDAYKLTSNYDYHNISSKSFDTEYIGIDASPLNFYFYILNRLNTKKPIIINFNNRNPKIEYNLTLNQLKEKQIEVHSFVDSEVVTDINDGPYLNILKRINSNFSFKYLEMYSNPEINDETIKISQSVVIDEIYRNIVKTQTGLDYRDVFMTAPTGSGKSVIFQIPAVLAAENHNLVTIVISPLIGLMNDQVDNIEKLTNLAATINSEYTPEEKENIKSLIMNGEKSILYISPETFLSNSDVTSLIGERELGLIVIDEAHTVATWGKSFRPDYWFLGDHLRTLRKRAKKPFIIAAFTATAVFGGPEDMVYEIQDTLFMTVNKPYIGKVIREDIKFNIRNHEVINEYVAEKQDIVNQNLYHHIEEGKKVLTYFPFVSTLDDYYGKFDIKFKNKIARYHARVEKNEKNQTLHDFKNGDKTLVFATKAFGMGIDVNDIEVVYHYAPTGNLADYIQEIGRAARKDGLIGSAETDYFDNDFRYIKQLYGISRIKEYEIYAVAEKLLKLYKKSGSKNLLVASEKFAHIFDGKEEDIDARLKTTLLILKKDIELNRNYNDYSLVFKPRSMFTKGLFLVPDDYLNYFKEIGWYKHFTKHESKEEYANEKNYTKRSYIGDVYELDLKDIWQEKFRDLTFQGFKSALFRNALAELDIDKKLIHKIVLEIEANNGESLNDTVNQLNSFLTDFEATLDFFRTQNKHFNLNDFTNKISEISTKKLKNDYQAEMISNSMLMMLNNFNISTDFGVSQFLRFNKKTEKHEIKNTKYKTKINKIKARLFKEIAKPYGNLIKKEFLINASGRQNNIIKQNIELMAAQMFEIIGAGQYSIISGNQPEFFIRVNSEMPLRDIVNGKNYKSKTLNTVSDRHNNSIKIMKHFFTKIDDDKSRWDLIEKYFLGENILIEIESN